MQIRLHISGFILFILAIPLYAQEIPSDTLTVHVQDIYTQGPVDAAYVRLYRHGHLMEAGFTDPSGQIKFIVDISATGAEELPPGRVTMLPAYPNPFAGKTSVPFSVYGLSRITATVHDILGRQVTSLRTSLLTGRYEIVADLYGLAPGTYFLRIVADNKILGTSALIQTAGHSTSEPASLVVHHTAPVAFNRYEATGKSLSPASVAYELEASKEGYEMSTSYINMPESRDITIHLLSANANTIGMAFIRIPAGVFDMGDYTGEHEREERPVHTVTLTRDFHAGKYEVTQDEYESVVGTNPSHHLNEDNLPVETVSWYDAIRFTNALSIQEGLSPCYDDEGEVIGGEGNPFACEGYRLLMEAEWEYVTRAETTTKYSFGDDPAMIDHYGWYRSTRTHPVGEKLPNPWGLYDLHGNAWEWVYDVYDRNYYGESPPQDPPGPPLSNVRWHRRILRGGGCDNFASPRSAVRNSQSPRDGTRCYGFRIARTAE